MKDLKDYRKKDLGWYTFGNIIIMTLFGNSSISNSLLYIFNSAKNTNTFDYSGIISVLTNTVVLTIFSSFIFMLVFILDSVIPSSFKEKLVFIFADRPMRTIFTTIRSTDQDDRFSQKQVQEQYAEIYKKIDTNEDIKQSAYWYNIYHKYRNESIIYNSNRDYFLSRDLFIQSIIVLIIYIILLLLNILNFSQIYISYIILLIILTNISSRNKSKKVAYNVIAYDINNSTRN